MSRGQRRRGPGSIHHVSRVVAIVAARNEEASVGETVGALRSLDGIAEVVVVDDGSTDATSAEALAAGARVLRTPRNRGKGGALELALDRIGPAEICLLVDADVGETASEMALLLRPVLAGEADLAIGVLPALGGGGFGLVKRLAQSMISSVGDFRPRAPLSGQRAVARAALEACRPIARGFGVETAMSMDAVRLGFKVMEVPVEMRHRATGRGVAGFAHRADQGWDILCAGLARLAGFR